MSIVPIPWSEVREAADRATVRVAGMLREAPDADARVEGLEWTVRELAAHLVSLTRRYQTFARGEGRAVPDDLGAFVEETNARDVAAYRDRDLGTLAGMVEEGMETLFSLLPSPDAPVNFYDLQMDAASLLGVALDELVVHGLDLARTLGRPWRVDRREALLSIAGLVAILPRFVDPDAARGFRATYLIKPRGGVPFAMRFEHGELTITTQADGLVDCRISADPVAFLLVGLGREPRWKAILQGKLLAYGRKPWLALRFNDLFVNA